MRKEGGSVIDDEKEKLMRAEVEEIGERTSEA